MNYWYTLQYGWQNNYAEWKKPAKSIYCMSSMDKLLRKCKIIYVDRKQIRRHIK